MSKPNCTFLAHAQPRTSGDYLHRILWPAQALGSLTRCNIIQMTHPEVLDYALTSDVLIICMAIDDVLRQVVSIRKRHKLPTVFEISDDFQSFPSNTQMAAFYAQPKIQRQIMTLARACDAIQYSSPHLAEKYRFLNSEAVVFMNQAQEIPPLSQRKPHTPLQIGWTASGGHLEDGYQLGQYLWEALREIPPEQVALSAMTTPAVWKALTASGLSIRHQPTGTFAQYQEYLRSLDIGLAHLTQAPFAQGRSDGKYIEYTTQGVVSICSASGTYKHTIVPEHNGFLYSTGRELGTILKRIIANPDLIEQVRQRAHTDIRENRNHDVAAARRLKYYASLCRHTYTDTSPAVFHHLEESENALMDLMLTQNACPSAELITRYKEFIKHHSDRYQAWMYLEKLFLRLGRRKEHLWCKERAEQRLHLALTSARNKLQTKLGC